MIIQPLVEAETLSELQVSLGVLASHHWGAESSHLLPYDDQKHVLRCGSEEWDLSADSQPGKCAKTLRPVNDQSLAWPENLTHRGAYRISRPIFDWGSLKAVLCLDFREPPAALPGVEEIEQALGLLMARAARRELTDSFMERCKELFVQAVETRGKGSHIKTCCRLVSSLASMMDCSPQVQADLLEAAQYHDVGLLTFNNGDSVEAQQEHSRVGASLLRCHPELFNVAELVENHHERYDGSGAYGKRGAELAIECWILALVEDFCEFWESSLDTYESKVRVFFTERAKHHHPDAVDALCGLVDAGKLQDIMS